MSVDGSDDEQSCFYNASGGQKFVGILELL